MNIKWINPYKGLKAVPEHKHPADISCYGYLHLSLNYRKEASSKSCPEKEHVILHILLTGQLDLHLK